MLISGQMGFKDKKRITMRRVAVLIPLLLLAAALDYGIMVEELPENPHAELNKEGTCDECHSNYLGELDPHGFEIDVAENCMQEKCHDDFESQMRRSHPVGVEPDDDYEIPEGLPLHDYEVTCGTCHNPHLDRLSRIKTIPWDAPAFFHEVESNGRATETEYFYTYYLRGRDAEHTLERLCNACHKNLI